MPIRIRLDLGVKGYEIIRKKCPNCGADFIFRLEENEVKDVMGDGHHYPLEQVVRCKICLGTYKIETES